MRTRMVRGILGVLVLLSFAIVGSAWSQGPSVTNENPLSIMRPDPEMLHQSIEDYEAAPPAQLDDGIAVVLMQSEMLNESTPLSLLSHLQYTPTERNQGYCGDCWVWAGTGAMEVALHVQNNTKDRLSVQFLNSCRSGSSACCGGNLSDFANWYGSVKKAIPWSNTNASFQDYYTECYDSSAVSCGNISTSPAYVVKSASATRIATNGYDGVYDQATAIANIKNILNQGKAIYLSFHLANDSDWDGFFNEWLTQPESHVWDPDSYCGHTWVNGEGGGHAVLIVGYDDSVGTPYWLVLNSWGTTSGRPNGLFRLKMNMNYGCIMHESGYFDWYSRQFWTLNMQFAKSPGKAVQIAPTGLILNNTPTYQWYAATDADRYLLAAYDSTGGWPVYKWYSKDEAGCSAGGTCSATPGETLWTGNCVWYVLTYDSTSGYFGPWSDGMTFTVPDKRPGATAPGSPSGRVDITTPTYTWNAISGADYYRVAVSDSKGGWAVDKWYSKAEANCSSGTGTCSVTSPALTPGSYTWCLVTYNSYGYGPWSSWKSFIVLIPGKVNLQSPISVITTNQPTYQWDADPYAQYYRLAVADSTGWPINQWYSRDDAHCGSGTGACWVTPTTPVASGTCIWYIQTYNSYGLGLWSDGQLFNPLGAATLISPTGAMSTNPPTYQWNAVLNVNVNAGGYYLLAVGNSKGWPVIKWYSSAEANCSSGTGTCSVTPPTALLSGQYWWYIQTYNSYGLGLWSSYLVFTVQ